MGAGSVALLWYACCCSFVAFVGIVASGLVVFGRTKEERERGRAERARRALEESPEAPTEPPDQGTSL